MPSSVPKPKKNSSVMAKSPVCTETQPVRGLMAEMIDDVFDTVKRYFRGVKFVDASDQSDFELGPERFESGWIEVYGPPHFDDIETVSRIIADAVTDLETDQGQGDLAYVTYKAAIRRGWSVYVYMIGYAAAHRGIRHQTLVDVV